MMEEQESYYVDEAHEELDKCAKRVADALLAYRQAKWSKGFSDLLNLDLILEDGHTKRGDSEILLERKTRDFGLALGNFIDEWDRIKGEEGNE